MGERGTRPAGAWEAATEVFTAHRNLLFTVAYEMLGSAADAEDVLQETWLKWAEVDHGAVAHPRAYLVRIATRQSLDRLRRLNRRKESYVGSWLPEPLLTAPDVAEDVELAENLSMAMLLVLETLTPIERAVFLLRDVFDLPYDDIGRAVGKTPAAVRQIARRARTHVTERRPRTAPSPSDARAALRAFQAAVETGELQQLLDILAPDVVALSDGGGLRQALPRPVAGAAEVARLLAGDWWRRDAERTVEQVQVNGGPGLLVRVGGLIDGVLAVHVEHGLVKAAYHVRNPEKLTRMETEAGVSLG